MQLFYPVLAAQAAQAGQSHMPIPRWTLEFSEGAMADKWLTEKLRSTGLRQRQHQKSKSICKKPAKKKGRRLFGALLTFCQPGPNQISQVLLPEQDTVSELFGKLN